MALFCLPPKITNTFLKAIKSGEIDPLKLADIKDSSERRDYLSKFVGEENAKGVNTLFEEKMALKNQEFGYIDWIKSVGGLKPEIKNDFVSQIQKMDHILSPDEQKAFLSDVAEKKLGLGVTREEAKTISELSNKVSDARNVKTIGDFVKQLDAIPKGNLTDQQKASIESLKEKVQSVTDEKQKAEDEKQRIKKELQQQKEDLKNVGKIEASERFEKERNLKELQRQYEKAQMDSQKAQEKFDQQEFKKSIGNAWNAVKESLGDQLPGDISLEDIHNLRMESKGSTMFDVSPEYMQERDKLNNYVKSLTESSAWAKNLASIGRNNLLSNPSTPIKTIEGATVNTFIDSFNRRIAELIRTGDVDALRGNTNLTKEGVKEAMSFFNKTGYSPTSMSSINDHQLFRENLDLPSGAKGEEGILGKTKEGIRKVAKVSNNIIIKGMHGYGTVLGHAFNFFDMANIASRSIAREEGLTGDSMNNRAEEIFRDASKIEPTTDEGISVRALSQEHASRVMNINETWGGKLANGIKQGLNSIIPGVPLGDLVVPIAKVPANLIANGIDNAGIGLVTGAIDTHEGWQKSKSIDLKTRLDGQNQMRKGITKMVRVAGVLGVSAWIASHLTKDDYRTDTYGKSFIKIGNHWISMEYLAPITPALTGFMEAKNAKKGDNKLYDFAHGVFEGFKALPGIDEITSAINTNLKKYGEDFINSRVIPRVVQSFENTSIVPPSATPQTRIGERLLTGSTGVETTQEYNKDQAVAKKKATATRKANQK